MSEAETKPELTRLGSYAIVRKLARGGMAELFLARSVGPEGFEKLVVLKKILPKYAENPRFVQLFLDEAKLAASLDHPHIVHVYDMGRVDGHYFFTMEYVHGQDVRTILKTASRAKQDMPLAIAVQIARTMASALHHAHERRHADGTLRNIVHRDVSPSNILVSYDGAIKLADFGVAKAQGSSVRTRTGALKGKVGYMSPEQARGATVDRRSDIFALGVVLWELVTMRRLFKSDNDLATIQAIINTPPPPLAELRPNCPPELDRIVRMALDKDPDARYQNAQYLQRDLDELSRELKLDQSSIVVSTYMHDVFEAEIAALKAAQSQGVTVTDYVSHSGLGGAATTPVSESELSLEDPGDEEIEDDEIPDEDPSEPTDLPPRSGSIDRDADSEATDFGPPPSMDALRQGALNSTAAPKPAAGSPKSSPIPKIVPKPPVVAAKPPEKTGFENENPFDNAATRLRPNPMRDEDGFGDNAATNIAAPAFTDEAPTVTAPPELVKQAFAQTSETVQAHKFAIPAKPAIDVEPRTSPYGSTPNFSPPSGFEQTAVQFDPIDPTAPPHRSESTTSPMPMGRQTAIGHQAPDPKVPQPLPRGSKPAEPDPASFGASPDAFAQTMVDAPHDASSDTLHDPPPPMAADPNPLIATIKGGPIPPPGIPAHLAQHMSPVPIYGTPPVGAPSMLGVPRPGTPPVGSPAMMDPRGNVPAMYRAATGSQPLDPMPGNYRYPTLPVVPLPHDLDVDLAPHRRWLVIGGVAVLITITAIVLILVLGGGSPEPEPEPEPEVPAATPPKPDPAPAKAIGSAAVKAPTVKAPAVKAAGSGSAGSGSDAGSASGSASGSDAGSAAPTAPIVPVLPRPTPVPTKVIRPPRRPGPPVRKTR